jgi:hypothetical protein
MRYPRPYLPGHYDREGNVIDELPYDNELIDLYKEDEGKGISSKSEDLLDKEEQEKHREYKKIWSRLEEGLSYRDPVIDPLRIEMSKCYSLHTDYLVSLKEIEVRHQFEQDPYKFSEICQKIERKIEKLKNHMEEITQEIDLRIKILVGLESGGPNTEWSSIPII